MNPGTRLRGLDCLDAHPEAFGYTAVASLVGARGFEPPTPRSRTECSTRLSHAPTKRLFYPTAQVGRQSARQQQRPIQTPAVSTASVIRAVAGPPFATASLGSRGEVNERASVAKAHGSNSGLNLDYTVTLVKELTQCVLSDLNLDYTVTLVSSGENGSCEIVMWD